MTTQSVGPARAAARLRHDRLGRHRDEPRRAGGDGLTLDRAGMLPAAATCR
ncbi:hypothetical protein GALL_374360 [mine drainage metagenome]|uniref:Uncharacterized protein n=1 Tax=mine drainage metagenome TaxID=410659 RepID=A0A1J5QBL2_9ZZZZ